MHTFMLHKIAIKHLFGLGGPKNKNDPPKDLESLFRHFFRDSPRPPVASDFKPAGVRKVVQPRSHFESSTPTMPAAKEVPV
ncbi:MAG: hypothetical protein CME32_01465 [Gimesia sp.]|nr:hypothetical protein [Gimesia sp.]